MLISLALIACQKLLVDGIDNIVAVTCFVLTFISTYLDECRIIKYTDVTGFILLDLLDTDFLDVPLVIT